MSDPHVEHGAAAHAEAGLEHPQPLPEGVTRAYYAAFGLLLLLTAIEASTVLIFRLPAVVRVTVLIISACIKATLIGAYYMNLKFERVAMIGIAISPLLLAVLMFFMIAPDAAQRFGAR
ncbi:MAG TPA: cytochrome C oxidase subunit IV family protein [bacterium]|nr:cytochrome C oxidase subunit IV family protein [bacterium]